MNTLSRRALAGAILASVSAINPYSIPSSPVVITAATDREIAAKMRPLTFKRRKLERAKRAARGTFPRPEWRGKIERTNRRLRKGA